MSDANHIGQPPAAEDASHDVAHEGPIRTPKQLIVTVIAAFVVPIVIIILLVNFVDFGARTGAGTDALDPEAVARRIQPVGTIELQDSSAPAAAKTGEQMYQAVCSACHATGTIGAPKLGDTEAWAPRIKTGYDALLNSALHGKNAMPAQGGGEYSDVEIGRAVVYMANKAGASFAEPKAPAGAASGAEAASAPAN
jgi:cytochrome c5